VGVGISYETNNPVHPGIRAKILKEYEEDEDDWDWWAESIWLDDDECSEPCTVYGSTKLYLFGGNEEEEINFDEQQLLVWQDFNHIVTRLCNWSAKYGVDWNIDFESPIGSIVGGLPDRQLTRVMCEMYEDCVLPQSDSLRIRRKYASRMDDDYVAKPRSEEPPAYELVKQLRMSPDGIPFNQMVAPAQHL